MAELIGMTLVLPNGEEFEYTRAEISFQDGGVLRVAAGDDVTYYAPGAWSMVSHSRSQHPESVGVSTAVYS